MALAHDDVSSTAVTDDSPIRPDYESQTLRLADLVVTGDRIVGKTFSNCLLVGPIMLVPLEGVTISGCHFPGTPEEIVIVIDGPRRLFGAVGVEHCAFYGCRFSDVGFIGGPEFLDAFNSAARPPQD